MKTKTVRKIHNVLGTLDKILISPHDFGLGQGIPRPLADSLRTMRETLGQALREQDERYPDTLEAELSQDADTAVRTQAERQVSQEPEQLHSLHNELNY